MGMFFGNRIRMTATLVIVCNFIYWFTRSCIRPAFPLMLHDDISADSLGILLSIQSFLPIFFSLSAGAIGDRIGHGRILFAGAVLSLLSLIFYYLGFSGDLAEALVYPAWVAGMVLSGMAWLFIWLAVQSLATQPVAAEEEKGPSVSQMIYAISLTMSLGQILGPVATGFTLEWWGAEAFWLGQVGLSLVFAVLCFWLALKPAKLEPVEETPAPAKSRIRSVWTLGFPEYFENWSRFGGRPYAAVLLISLLMLFSLDIMATFVPAHLGDAGMSESEIGFVLIGGHLAGVAIRLVLATGWIRFSERGGMAAAMGLCVAGLFFMAVLPAGFAWVAVGVALGLAIGFGEPVGLQIIAHHAAADRRGLALGGRVLVNRIGMFLAPYLAFKVFAALGATGGGLLLSGGVAAIGAVAMWLLLVPEKKKDASE